MHDRLARKPMKPIPPDPFGSQHLGDWQCAGHVRQVGMKTRVEARNLWTIGEVGPRKTDDSQSRRYMQRREGDSVLQLLQNGVIDEAMPQKHGAAMDDAMSDSSSRREFASGQKLSDPSNGVF